MDFVHLHNHSDGSIADAILKPAELAKKAKEMGMSAVALTDHGVMYKLIEFYEACKKEGIKPILGMEAYVTPRVNTMKDEKIDSANYHLVLLAENETGYKNLIKIASDASVKGLYYKPRTDKHKLRQWSEGIIALSACIGGEVQKLILQDDYEAAKESALQYESIFGKGNFFLELQDHGIKEEDVCREKLIQMSRETGIPLVATNDCHYALPDDYEAHDLLLCVRDKVTVSNEKRMRYSSNQMYFKSKEEMTELFSYCPEAIENTVKIAKRCNVEIEFGKNKLPPFDVPQEFTKREFLEKLVYDGAKERYKEITPEINDRIQFELDVIEKMGYIEYFLIVWDFMKASRKKGILIGPGRGSAAGSIVCYCTRITQIDPLHYNLLFERFLDPSRVSMPDIDIDWQDDRRQEGIEYVKQKYGENSVCQIITFNNLMAKASVRAVARVLEYPVSMQDKIGRAIPAMPGVTIDDALETNAEFRDMYQNDKDVKRIVDLAKRLEGVSTSIGKHAAGILITDKQGVTAHVPVWQTPDGIVTQYSKDYLEELGLLKMDFLGLSNLTIISHCIENIKKNHNVDVDLYKLYEAHDLKPFKLIQDGMTQGIFQLESSGMTEFMQEMHPENINDLIAGVALYRPELSGIRREPHYSGVCI